MRIKFLPQENNGDFDVVRTHDWPITRIPLLLVTRWYIVPPRVPEFLVSWLHFGTSFHLVSQNSSPLGYTLVHRSNSCPRTPLLLVTLWYIVPPRVPELLSSWLHFGTSFQLLPCSRRMLIVCRYDIDVITDIVTLTHTLPVSTATYDRSFYVAINTLKPFRV